MPPDLSGLRYRKFLCGCGRFVAVVSNKRRPDGHLCLRNHKQPDGSWCTRNRLVLSPSDEVAR